MIELSMNENTSSSQETDSSKQNNTTATRCIVRLKDRSEATVDSDDAHCLHRCHHHTTALKQGDGSVVACDLTDDERQQLEQSASTKDVQTDPIDSQDSQAEDTPIDEQDSQRVPYGIEKVGATDLHEQGITGKGVEVAVLDGGCAPNHPDLNVEGGSAWPKSQRSPPEWDDDTDHGTHVAGTGAALDNDIGVLGIAPDALVYAYKVLSHEGTGYRSDIVDGMVQAVDDGRDILCMSLSGDPPAGAYADGVRYAHQHDVPVFCSTGNGSCSDCVGVPAACDDAVAVGACDENDDVAPFMSKGTETDITAPGVGVDSLVPGGYGDGWDGTSMSQPHVSFGCALLSGNSTDMSPVEAKQYILENANDIGLSDAEQGNGLLDLVSAYGAFESDNQPEFDPNPTVPWPPEESEEPKEPTEPEMNHPYTLEVTDTTDSNERSWYTFKLNDGGQFVAGDRVNDSDGVTQEGLRAGGRVSGGTDNYTFGPEGITFDPEGCNIDGQTDGIKVLINGVDYGPNGRDVSNFNTIKPTEDPEQGMSNETVDVDETSYNVTASRPHHTTADLRIFVDPDGSNDNTGTRQNPLGTLQEAADRIPHLLQHNVKIVLRDGVHENSNFFTGTHICNYVGDEGGYEIISDSGDKEDCEVHLSNGHFSIGTVGGDPLNAVKITDIDFHCQLQCYDTAFIDGCTIRGPPNPNSDRGSRCLGGYDNMVRVQNTTFTDQQFGIAVKDNGTYHCLLCDIQVDEAMRSYGCGGDARFKSCEMNDIGQTGMSDVQTA